MGNNWIDTVINEQYQFVRLLKRTDKTEICVLGIRNSANRL